MKTIASFFVVFLICGSTHAQGFYDLNTVQTIEITFAQSNWDALLDAEKAGNENYIMAQSITINGETFDSVGVKYKGNSTYNANQVKNPLHIELNTYKEQEYQGYSDIKLSNVAKDPSFLREVLSYQILRQYMEAPLSNYTNVYINGNLMGLYSNSESVGKKFVKNRFYSKNNTFVKCNPPAGAGPGTTAKPNLVYLGEDSASYYTSYEMQSDAGWGELIDLCDTLKNNVGSVEKILDVDRALWMLAFDNVLVNLDSYIGGFAQNYYLYRDDNGRFNTVVWDLNESFGQFSMTGSGSLSNTTAKQQMSHLLNETNANYPLVSKLLSVPTYKRMYLAHFKTILLENFHNGTYATTAQTLQTLIGPSVQADPNKFYTYANFLSNLNSDITTGGGPMGGSTPGITNLMNGRSTYLLALSDFTATEPTISNINLSNNTPSLNENITITATVTNENTVYLGYRDDVMKPFARVLMYDDGAHNDAVANDGIYGVGLNVSSAEMQFYVYAENSNIGKFSPVRAEHEFHTINASFQPGALVINEFMADNESAIADQAGEYEDWIELYNNSNASIALGDYYLTDDLENPTQFKLPNENLAAGGFKLIWASGDTTKGSNHANFKLSKSGEEIGLFLPNGNGMDTIDYIVFSTQSTDVSYGRESDAAANWIFFNTSTPNATNQTTKTTEVATTGVKIYPNPYRESVTLENPTADRVVVTVYSSIGSVIGIVTIPAYTNETWIDTAAPGMRVFAAQKAGVREVVRMVKQ